MREDRAGRWIRVSGDSQSEADQLPDINDYCDDRQYIKGKPYEVHGKSAYKGAQDPCWAEVVKDIQDDVIDVVVCWMVDRLDRQNILHAIPMVSAVLDAGGRIEFSEQPECNLDAKSPTLDEELEAFTRRIHDAHRESKIKSKRILKKQRKLRESGSAIGRAPYGYRIQCRDFQECDGRKCGHVKIFAPTADGRKYVPLIFQMAIDGKSLREIAQWLHSHHVLTDTGNERWNESYLGSRLIKNPVYYGKRVNAGALKTEPLVTYSVWAQANAALASRIRPGRGTVKHDKAMLSPVCGNPDCDATGAHPSPMYRMFGGNPADRNAYYRCTGRGPTRKGCGNMIKCAELDMRATDAMTSDHLNQHADRVFIAGDDRSDEIGKLRESAMAAYRKGDKTLFLTLDAQADELASLPSVPPHWEDKPTGQSEGQYFASLDMDARREYLRTQEVSAYHDSDGGIILTIGPPIAREYAHAA